MRIEGNFYDYLIVEGLKEDLEEEIHYWMSEGFRPAGGLCLLHLGKDSDGIDCPIYAQALTKED